MSSLRDQFKNARKSGITPAGTPNPNAGSETRAAFKAARRSTATPISTTDRAELSFMTGPDRAQFIQERLGGHQPDLSEFSLADYAGPAVEYVPGLLPGPLGMAGQTIGRGVRETVSNALLGGSNKTAGDYAMNLGESAAEGAVGWGAGKAIGAAVNFVKPGARMAGQALKAEGTLLPPVADTITRATPPPLVKQPWTKVPEGVQQAAEYTTVPATRPATRVASEVTRVQRTKGPQYEKVDVGLINPYGAPHATSVIQRKIGYGSAQLVKPPRVPGVPFASAQLVQEEAVPFASARLMSSQGPGQVVEQVASTATQNPVIANARATAAKPMSSIAQLLARHPLMNASAVSGAVMGHPQALAAPVTMAAVDAGREWLGRLSSRKIATIVQQPNGIQLLKELSTAGTSSARATEIMVKLAALGSDGAIP